MICLAEAKHDMIIMKNCVYQLGTYHQMGDNLRIGRQSLDRETISRSGDKNFGTTVKPLTSSLLYFQSS